MFTGWVLPETLVVAQVVVVLSVPEPRYLVEQLCASTMFFVVSLDVVGGCLTLVLSAGAEA